MFDMFENNAPFLILTKTKSEILSGIIFVLVTLKMSFCSCNVKHAPKLRTMFSNTNLQCVNVRHWVLFSSWENVLQLNPVSAKSLIQNATIARVHAPRLAKACLLQICSKSACLLSSPENPDPKMEIRFEMLEVSV